MNSIRLCFDVARQAFGIPISVRPFDELRAGSAHVEGRKRLFSVRTNEDCEQMLMTSWELIFLQSRVNHGTYDGDNLPAQNWDWPRGTWFQERLEYLRARRRQIAQRNSFKMKPANGPTVSRVSPGQESTTMANQGQIPGHFSIAPLLLVEQENSAEVRQALLEERRYEMNLTLTMLLIAFTALAACVSPEATRTRGGGPGADLGNRTKVVEMHEGSLPFWQTPQIIATKHAPTETADQAYALSRR